MRKLTGFVVSVLMVMAVGGLTAPPSFATDYFVKYLNTEGSGGLCPHAPAGTEPRHGTVVFRRAEKSMFATVNLRNVSPGSWTAFLFHRSVGGSCGYIFKDFTTSGGNGTVTLGPVPRAGNQAFWVRVYDGSVFITGEVPAFGF